jgi:hypothetical protein
MANTQADADMAAKDVLEGHAKIAKLRREIADAKDSGFEIEAREYLLHTFQTSLELMMAHQCEIADQLTRVKQH